MKRLIASLLLALTLFAQVGHAAIALSSASLTAQNTFSTGAVMQGYFNLSISGTWVATVHLQRSFDGGSNWLDVQSYTANIQDRGYEPEAGVQYRCGVKTGNYTSGTVVCRVSR